MTTKKSVAKKSSAKTPAKTPAKTAKPKTLPLPAKPAKAKVPKTKTVAVKEFNFVRAQTHNKYDCKPHHVNGRYGMVRDVGLRMGLIINVLKDQKILMASEIVDTLNKSFKGANYRYTDIYPTLNRMIEGGMIQKRNISGGLHFKLTPKAEATYKRISDFIGKSTDL